MRVSPFGRGITSKRRSGRNNGETMTDVVLERTFDPPTSLKEFTESAAKQEGCFDLYRVDWQCSLMAKDRKRLICWFRGIDVESVRTALRMNDVDTQILWGGSYHEAPDLAANALAGANVVVERRFDAPTTLAEIQAIEDAGAQCLEMRNVEFVCTLFCTDRTRMICLYRAPDAESVRQAQREAGMPFEAVWACDVISQDTARSLR
jgi:hypothetical protein